MQQRWSMARSNNATAVEQDANGDAAAVEQDANGDAAVVGKDVKQRRNSSGPVELDAERRCRGG